MEDEALGWAEVACTKLLSPAVSDNRGKDKKTINNIYSIAIDLGETRGDVFTCPCCGDELAYEIMKAGKLSGENKKKIVSEKQEQSMRFLNAFIAASAIIASVLVAGIFIKGAYAAGLGGAAAFLLACIWIPLLVYLIRTALLLRDRDAVVRQYEQCNPIRVALRSYGEEKSGCKHRFVDFPDLIINEKDETGYGLE
jgi:hypothetical protein